MFSKPLKLLSTYIAVHDRTVKTAYDGLSEVGGSSDEEGHGEQEEGGGGVQLHHQVLGGEGGGGQASQVAKHLKYSDFGTWTLITAS